MDYLQASPRVSLQGDSRLRRFPDFRFQINNYFEYFRSGRLYEYKNRGEEPWNDLNNPQLALVSRDSRRIVGSWNRIYSNRSFADIIRAQNPFRSRYGGRGNSGGGGRNNPRASRHPEDKHLDSPHPHLVVVIVADNGMLIDNGVQRLRGALQAQGVNVRYLRILGAGGNGLAALFDIQHGTADPPKKFVVKTSLDPRSDMALEKYFMVVCTIL